MGVIAERVGEARVYDFQRPEALERARLRRLQPVLEVLAHRVAGSLTGALRTPVRVEIAEVDQQPWEEYSNGLPDPTFLASALIVPYGGRVVLHTPLPLAMALVDLRLGGPGKEPFPERPLTEIEQQLVGEVAQGALAELGPAFEPIINLDVGAVTFVASTMLLQGRPNETCLLVGLHIDIRGGELVADANLCIPVTVLMPILDALDRLDKSEGEHHPGTPGEDVRERVFDTPVEVSVHFPDVALSPDELLTLSVGDVVPLRRRADAPLLLSVANVRYHDVVATTVGRRLACMVIEEEGRKE